MLDYELRLKIEEDILQKKMEGSNNGKNVQAAFEERMKLLNAMKKSRDPLIRMAWCAEVEVFDETVVQTYISTSSGRLTGLDAQTVYQCFCKCYPESRNQIIFLALQACKE